jgi:hypothetical protein
MVAGACGRDFRGCPQPDDPDAEAHIAKWREAGLYQVNVYGQAIDFQHDGTEDLARILFTLGVRNLTIAVGIDPSKYPGCHGGAGRKVDLQIHAIYVDRQSRGLEIFIEPMRGGGSGSCEPGA